MSKNPNETVGRIMVHAHGVGEASTREVAERAQEIAGTEGRPEATIDDREQAETELLGGGLPPLLEDDAETMDSLSRDPSDPPAHHGRQIPNQEVNDDENTERLVMEGVEEAQHDQMLSARRNKDIL